MNDQPQVAEVIPSSTSSVLPGAIALMKEAGQRLKKNFRVLIQLEVITWILAIILVACALIFYVPLAKDSEGSSSSMGGAGLLLIVVGAVVRLAISVAQIRLLAGETSMTLGEAWKQGWRRIIPVAACGLLLGVVFLLMLSLIVLPLFSAIVLQLSGHVNGILALAQMSAMTYFVSVILLVPLYVFLFVRLSFVVSLAAIGETHHPFGESWNLTKGKFWVVFWRLLVASIVFGLVGSLLNSSVYSASNLLFGGSADTNGVVNIISRFIGLIFQFIVVLYGLAYSISLLRNIQKLSR